MKKLLIFLPIFLSESVFADSNWSQSLSKDEQAKEYQIYSNLSLNSDKSSNKIALILVSPKENIFSKIGFAKTDGAIQCPNFCQYFIKFDNTAFKYTFSIENKSIKLENSQNEDFLNKLKNSKEMSITINQTNFFFNIANPKFSLSSTK